MEGRTRKRLNGGEASSIALDSITIEKLKVEVYVLTMQNGENRFDPSFLKDFLSCLDQVEAQLKSQKTGWGAALLTTGGGGQPAGKFYSNGIDLEWVAERRKAEEDSEALLQLGQLFGTAAGRLLSFPIPTFAVLNGHCFAGGFMLAMAHDYRLMREDRGWLCLPALDLGISLAAPFYEMLKLKLRSPLVLRQLAVECRRYSGLEASSEGLVDWTGPLGLLMPTALEWAVERASKGAGTHTQAFSELKQALYGSVVKAMLGGTSIDYPRDIPPAAARNTTIRGAKL